MKEEEPTAFSDAASATGLMWECIDVNEPEYGIYRHDDPDPVAVLSSVDDAERYIIEQAELAWRRVESDTLREANASLRRKLAPNQDCEGQGCQANALMVALRAAEEALERLLEEASEVARGYDDEDLTEACRVARAVLTQRSRPENTEFLPGTMGRTDGLTDDMGG